MKNNKYENQKIVKDISDEDYLEAKDNKVHRLIYNVVGFFAFLLFTIMFGGAGILSILQEDIDSSTRIIGIIFGITAIFIGFKALLFGKSIIKNISDLIKEKKLIITIYTIGYFIYSLAVMTPIFLIILSFINPKSELLNEKYKYVFNIMGLEAIIGAILFYVDAIMTSYNKNTKIVKIDKEKDNK